MQRADVLSRSVCRGLGEGVWAGCGGGGGKGGVGVVVVGCCLQSNTSVYCTLSDSGCGASACLGVEPRLRRERRDANQMSRSRTSKHEPACLRSTLLHCSPQAHTARRTISKSQNHSASFFCSFFSFFCLTIRAGRRLWRLCWRCRHRNSRETSEAFKQFRSADYSYLHSVITESFHNLSKLFTHVQKLLLGSGVVVAAAPGLISQVYGVKSSRLT